jgi:hypothetical protein
MIEEDVMVGTDAHAQDLLTAVVINTQLQYFIEWFITSAIR